MNNTQALIKAAREAQALLERGCLPIEAPHVSVDELFTAANNLGKALDAIEQQPTQNHFGDITNMVGEAYQLAGQALSGVEELSEAQQNRLLDILGCELPELIEKIK
jgi:hypothetical protein